MDLEEHRCLAVTREVGAPPDVEGEEIRKEASVFAVGQHVSNGVGTRYASSPTGANFDVFAIGIKYKFQ